MKIQFNSLPVFPLRITSRFGFRNTGLEGASTYHRGIDLGRNFSKAETEILSVADGTISNNYWNNTRGWVVIIDHGNFKTLYQHLKTKSPLRVGEKVQAGQPIGLMGASTKTIRNMAMHLHLELIVGGLRIDPEPYLKNIVKKVEDLTEEETRKIVKEEIKQILEGRESKVAECFQEVWSDAQGLGYTDGSRPGGYTTRQEVVSMIQRSKK
ncbi:M23 family metallopeptidase [Sinanaerobacter sp. ZZT-01]|uniref:M23 family metallopeptidase n=1 Tax=Sinanaerobacter sp. ZZT-01 TaxID=3111540 RepID=UPI002D765427|nr:M23 family metallopeptidase [Sinanaerobacter sp. ZZT-01]WRR94076.1 M23 family metallopeptidase [Sinanaerobacter sp. ZZT-01]